MFSATMCPISTLVLMTKIPSGWTKPLNWKLCKKYIQNRRFESDFFLLEALITEIDELVSTTKRCIMKILVKCWIIPNYKQKRIGQYWKHFITAKQIL